MKKALRYFLLLMITSSIIGCSGKGSEKIPETNLPTEQGDSTKKDTEQESTDETLPTDEPTTNETPSSNNEEEETETSDTSKDTSSTNKNAQTQKEPGTTQTVNKGTKQEYLNGIQYAYNLDAVVREDIDTQSKKVAIQDALKAWDDELNKIYQLLKKSLSSADKKLLIEDENKWIAFRDEASVKAGKSFEGGTLQPIAEGESLVESTKARTLELINYYFGEGEFVDDMQYRVDTLEAAEFINDKYGSESQEGPYLSIVFDNIIVIDNRNYYAFHIDQYELGEKGISSYSLYMEQVLVSFEGEVH